MVLLSKASSRSEAIDNSARKINSKTRVGEKGIKYLILNGVKQDRSIEVAVFRISERCTCGPCSALSSRLPSGPCSGMGPNGRHFWNNVELCQERALEGHRTGRPPFVPSGSGGASITPLWSPHAGPLRFTQWQSSSPRRRLLSDSRFSVASEQRTHFQCVSSSLASLT